MKYFLILIGLCCFSSINLAQQINPVTQEITYYFINEKWQKAKIIIRAYQKDGSLRSEHEQYYEARLDEWYDNQENHYRQDGQLQRQFFRYYVDRESGFTTTEFRYFYNSKNQQTRKEEWLQPSQNEVSQLVSTTERRYLDENGSHINEVYSYNNEQLLFETYQLVVLDENGEQLHSSYHNAEQPLPEEVLPHLYRMTTSQLPEGQTLRRLEILVCPQDSGCDEWELVRQNIRNEQNQLLYVEEVYSFNKVFETYYYRNDEIEVVKDWHNYNAVTDTYSLAYREIERTDRHTGKVLSIQRIEPFSTYTGENFYDENGRIIETHAVFTRKDSTGFITSESSDQFSYTLFCDDLVKERLRESLSFEFKELTTYSYLYPPDCAVIATDFDFTLHPNPAGNQIFLESEDFQNIKNGRIAIYDAVGRLVLENQLERGNTQILDIDFLSAGFYTVTILGGKEPVSKKIIVR